jgi:thiamine biosynthesis lipoprotein
MPLFRFAFRAMAADNELQLVATTPDAAHAAAQAAIADVARIEAKYSRYRDDSLTTRINRAAGSEPVAIDDETAALLRYADHCHQVSGGRFDITSGVLRRAWDFRRTPPRVPAQQAIDDCLRLIDWRGVEWTDRSVRLPRKGMEIDFGGIGKEYAADRAATICAGHAILGGLVNLAGDVRVIGTQEGGTPWRVAIRHPRAPRAMAYVEAVDAAVATSGDYERYFDLDGRRYCHILDPRTGVPVDYWQSVSVVAPLCVVAGSCATVAMLLEEAGEAFLREQGFRYLAVARDGSVHGAAADA